MHMLESERNDSTKNLGNTKTNIPYGKPRGLFASGVILAANKHQRWPHRSFKNAQEYSRYQ